MKKINKILLVVLGTFSSFIFADDIVFLSPTPVQFEENTVIIQISPPMKQVPVQVWIKSEMNESKTTLWKGVLDSKNNYTLQVDVSQFSLGAYEIKAEYSIGKSDYDGDVIFWVHRNITSEGQYL